MPIVVGVSSTGSTVGNYSGLVQSVIDTLKDNTLEDRVPDFIRRAEARFNRLLYALDDEAAETISATVDNTGIIDLPSDAAGSFKKPRSLVYESDSGSVVLPQLSPDDFNSRFLDAPAGPPEAFALAKNRFYIGPTPDQTYTLSLIYVETLNYLSSSNQSNWLIEAHPDLYYFGALMYAEIDGWNDERARDFDGAVDKIIAEIQFADAQKRRGDKQESVAGVYF